MRNNLQDDGTFPVELADVVNGAREESNEAYKEWGVAQAKVREIQTTMRNTVAKPTLDLLQDDLASALKNVDAKHVAYEISRATKGEAEATYGGVSL